MDFWGFLTKQDFTGFVRCLVSVRGFHFFVFDFINSCTYFLQIVFFMSFIKFLVFRMLVVFLGDLFFLLFYVLLCACLFVWWKCPKTNSYSQIMSPQVQKSSSYQVMN